MAPLLSAANLFSVAGIFGIHCCSVRAFRPLSNGKRLSEKRLEESAKVVEDKRKAMELFREAMILEGIRDSFIRERKFYLERKRVLRCQLEALENEKNGKGC